MKAIVKFIGTVYRAFRIAAVDPIVDAVKAVAKGKKLDEKQKGVIRELVIAALAVGLHYVRPLKWASNCLAMMVVFSAMSVIVDFIEALGQGAPETAAA